jgi:hypothetical protein
METVLENSTEFQIQHRNGKHFKLPPEDSSHQNKDGLIPIFPLFLLFLHAHRRPTEMFYH